MKFYRVVWNPAVNKHITLIYNRLEEVIDLNGNLKKGVFTSPRQAKAVEGRLNKKEKNAKLESYP
jgi:hypothetical protein